MSQFRLCKIMFETLIYIIDQVVIDKCKSKTHLSKQRKHKNNINIMQSHNGTKHNSKRK